MLHYHEYFQKVFGFKLIDISIGSCAYQIKDLIYLLLAELQCRIRHLWKIIEDFMSTDPTFGCDIENNPNLLDLREHLNFLRKLWFLQFLLYFIIICQAMHGGYLLIVFKGAFQTSRFWFTLVKHIQLRWLSFIHLSGNILIYLIAH